jgi:hypothetical protein
MTSLALSQAARDTGLSRITITRAIKARWPSASRKDEGSYEVDTVAPKPSQRRVRSLLPWHRSGGARAEAELPHRLALAEEQLGELKKALDDMRAQRDAWQAMAQARIRPTPSGQGWWPWLRSSR